MTGLSLRHRFLLIAALITLILVAAGVALVQLEARTDTGRRRTATARGEALVRALLARPEALARPAEALRGFLGVQPTAELDGGIGYCGRDGELLAAMTGAGYVLQRPAHGGALPPLGPDGPAEGHRPYPVVAGDQLLPADHSAVAAACRSAGHDRPEFREVDLPRDVLRIAAMERADGLVAWAMLRSPPARAEAGDTAFVITLTALGVFACLLVLLVLDALVALRRGAADLRAGLLLLEGDLQAAVPVPRTAELATVARGIGGLAAHLVAGQERERALGARLEHERRLAGLGRVVAGVAHEVRTPLTGLKLTLETMARRPLDPRTAGNVATCLQEVGRLERVVTSLLLVARRTPPEKRPTDLAALSDERLAHAGALAERRGIRLAREGHGSAPCDPEALARVLDNLVKNAVEASPDGGVVTVTLASSDGTLRVAVRDAGPGAPEEHVPELFEPFFTLKPDGTGLGLFLSRSVVEAHGGRLTYLREGGATHFVFTLPQEDGDG